MVKEWILLGILGWFSYEDIRKKTLNQWGLILAGVAGIVIQLIQKENTWMSIFVGVGVGLAIMILSWTTKESIGMGDGLLLMVTGIFLGGKKNMEMFLLGIVYAAIYALGIMVFSKKNGKGKRQLPFVPALWLGYITMCLGDFI